MVQTCQILSLIFRWTFLIEGVCGLPLPFQSNFKVSLYLKIGYLDLKVKSFSLLDEGLCKRSHVNSFFKASENFRAFRSHLSLN